MNQLFGRGFGRRRRGFSRRRSSFRRHGNNLRLALRDRLALRLTGLLRELALRNALRLSLRLSLRLTLRDRPGLRLAGLLLRKLSLRNRLRLTLREALRNRLRLALLLRNRPRLRLTALRALLRNDALLLRAALSLRTALTLRAALTVLAAEFRLRKRLQRFGFFFRRHLPDLVDAVGKFREVFIAERKQNAFGDSFADLRALLCALLVRRSLRCRFRRLLCRRGGSNLRVFRGILLFGSGFRFRKRKNRRRDEREDCGDFSFHSRQKNLRFPWNCR